MAAKKQSALSVLFQPGTLGKLTVKNRLVMPPMVRNYADQNGNVTDRYVAHIARIAAGGVGTIILEASYISPEGKGFVNQLGIHNNQTIVGLKQLVAAAHKYGAVIGPQIYHAGRQTSAQTSGMAPIAPSAIPDPTVGEMPQPMDEATIKKTIAAYGAAARRAKEAGCDFVELHGAHGYLITQFLSPFSNKRTDAYGGNFEKRLRFLLEVYAAVHQAVGPDFPVLLRLSGEEMVEGGLTIQDTIAIVQKMKAVGVDAVHISVGNYASYARGRMIPPMAVPDGPLVSLAEQVKKAVDIPVITVAKIRDPHLAEKIIKDGQADFVAIGRTLLADPEWPRKVKEGRLKDIHPCIACNQGCISRLFAQQDVWCTVNPETGREMEFSSKPRKAKKVVVIGGGPAGLSAAKSAAARGHKVILYEKESKLGGQLFAAEAAPYRQGWKEFREAITREIKQLGVDIRLKKEAGPKTIRALKPDAIIIAIGSSAMVPKISGVGRMNTVISRDVLEGRVKAKGRVVVVGGGCAGAQTAEFLADRGHHVSIVEATAAFATDAPVDERALLLIRLHQKGVEVLTETKIMSIGAESVVIENFLGPSTIPADTVVLCVGSFSNDGLYQELKKSAPYVKVVGDAVSPRRVTDAVAEGALAALEI